MAAKGARFVFNADSPASPSTYFDTREFSGDTIIEPSHLSTYRISEQHGRQKVRWCDAYSQGF